MSDERFTKLSGSLTKQGYGDHIIMVRDEEGWKCYIDPNYIKDCDLRNIFQWMADAQPQPND